MNRKQIEQTQKYLEDELNIRTIKIEQPNPIANWIIIVAIGIFLAWLAVMAATS